MVPIDEETKQQLKQNKLRQLSMQHYEMQLQKAMYAARGENALATQMDSELTKIEASYIAVEIFEA